MNMLVFPNITITTPNGTIILSEPFTAEGVLVDGVMSFEPSQWAPGVFAGMDFATCYIDNTKYQITAIDLSKRQVHVKEKE